MFVDLSYDLAFACLLKLICKQSQNQNQGIELSTLFHQILLKLLTDIATEWKITCNIEFLDKRVTDRSSQKISCNEVNGKAANSTSNSWPKE